MTLTLNNLPPVVTQAIDRQARNKSAFLRQALAREFDRLGEKEAARTLESLNRKVKS